MAPRCRPAHAHGDGSPHGSSDPHVRSIRSTAGSSSRGSVARQAASSSAPTSTCRSMATAGHRRHPDHLGRAHHRALPEERGRPRARVPPRAPEGQGRIRATRCARSPPGSASCSGVRSPWPPIAWGPRSKPRPAGSARARCSCSRTCASTRRKRPTTRLRPAARRARRPLRRRRLRRRPPRPRVDRGGHALPAARRGRAPDEAGARGARAGSSSAAAPVVAVLGGAKVSDKLALVEHLLDRVDGLVIGGGMAFTFLAALGHAVGRSLLEPDRVPAARVTLARARQRGVAVGLPVDVVAASSPDSTGGIRTVTVREIPADLMGLDIGAGHRRPLRGRAQGRGHRSSGTGRWASSRRRPSRPARSGRPRRRGLAGVQRDRRRRHDRRRAGRRRGRASVTSRRQAARSSSTWRAGCFRASPPSTTREGAMRVPLIVANWKMHGGLAEGKELAQAVRDGLRRARGAEVVICAPYTSLTTVGGVLAGSPIGLGAQNCHWEQRGAFTGEVSAEMLAEAGCRLVLVGHSERRTSSARPTRRSARRSRRACGLACSRSCASARRRRSGARG